MAITYNIKKCKGGYYGIYVRALSNSEEKPETVEMIGLFKARKKQKSSKKSIALYALHWKFPELEIVLNEDDPDFGKITLDGKDFSGALKVNSNRIARTKTEEQARDLINKFKSSSEDDQLKRLAKYRMWIVDKDRILPELKQKGKAKKKGKKKKRRGSVWAIPTHFESNRRRH